MDNYILNGHTPVPVSDIHEWAKFMESGDRSVAKTLVGPYLVSTVFLSIDHSFGGGPPLLFETMIFKKGDYKGEFDYQTRCSTWEQAEAMHKEAVAYVKGLK